MRSIRRGIGIVLLAGMVAACGVRAPSPLPHREERPPPPRKRVSYTIPTPKPGVQSDTVVGEVRTHRVRKGDTLLDLARYYDLGFEEMQQANPGVDPWVPPVGSRVVVPMRFVLPCCTYEGFVVNVPELRAYFYRPGKKPGTTIVETYPMGLGRNEWPTPLGVFRVKGKTVNPAWGVPESIRREHIRERGDGRRFIKGGDPDNPLGKYRFELDRTLYRIHGTNMPWGIGRQVSHGCAQLYPEDVEHLFPLMPIGTRVEFVYQPVKIGQDGGATWVEAHRDIYKRRGKPLDQAVAALKKRGLQADPVKLESAVRAPDGVPRLVYGSERRWFDWVQRF